MPITALVGDTIRRLADPMPVHAAQPWDCMSGLTPCTLWSEQPCPWLAKIGGTLPAKYMFTVGHTDSEVADDPAQHRQSRMLEL